MKLIKSIFALMVTVCLLIGAVWGIYALYPLKHVEYIRTYADENGVDRYLVAALIKAESNFNEFALSDAYARGAMQLTDETAAFCARKVGIRLKENDIYDPGINIRLGVYYLNRMLELFGGDESLAVAAYNAGEGRVREWLQDPTLSTDGETLDTIPYEETRRHVEKISSYKKIYRVLYPNL